MSIRRISDKEDAKDALCDGALFQVGDVYIDPDDVVRVTRDQDDQPVYHLSDGTQVTHDRYAAGETGDLLAQALPKAVRVGNQSEQFKPAFNRVLAANDQTYRKKDGSIIHNYNVTNSLRLLRVDTGAGKITGDDGSSSVVRNIDGSNVQSIAYASTLTRDSAFAAANRTDAKLLQFVGDSSGPTVDVHEKNYDGSNAAGVQTGIGVLDENIATARCKSGRIVFLVSGNDDQFNSLTADGSGGVAQRTEGDAYSGLAIDPDAKRIFSYNDFTGDLESFPYDLSNKSVEANLSVNPSNIKWNKNVGALIIFDANDDTFKAIDLDGNVQETYFGLSNNQNVFDIALDKSVI
jgi:hypothetical protein